MPFAQKRMGFTDPPKLFLRGDDKNAQNPLGKTAYYDPSQKSITIYITGRHPKDVMRSISHELVHHAQNCRGEFDKPHQMGDGYAQNDAHMREMEREAYEVGNMCFRDWEDGLKNTIYLEHLQKGDKKMSTKDWKNNEIKSLLAESWGFKMDLNKLNENQKEYDLDENAEGRAFAPNHYCAHHVKFEGREAYTVDHNWDETLQEVTEYDLKFEDGTIQRNVPAVQLEVLEASELDEGEDHLRDHPPVKRKKVKKMKEEDDVELNEEEEEEESAEDEDDRKPSDAELRDARKFATRSSRDAVGRTASRRSRGGMGIRGVTKEETELEEGEGPPDEDKDGVPDFRDEKPGEDDNAGKKKKKDLSKVPPQLRKHMKGKMDEARMREIIAYALKTNKG